MDNEIEGGMMKETIKDLVLAILFVAVFILGLENVSYRKMDKGWQMICDAKNDHIKELQQERFDKLTPDEKVIEKSKVGKEILLYISNEHNENYEHDYYVQYFNKDHTVMGIRRDKPFLELLDEIVADIKWGWDSTKKGWKD